MTLVAPNTSGGVLGKMVSPQNQVIGWSLVLLLFMCILVGLQSTFVLGWMVP